MRFAYLSFVLKNTIVFVSPDYKQENHINNELPVFHE